ncbi:MAG: hypothetical protein A3G49_03650, partial [Candidatus Sungbacteria bacterium RIFCSPLOWO2_12_FULL_41_11]
MNKLLNYYTIAKTGNITILGITLMDISILKQAKTFALDTLFPKICFGCKKEGFFLCKGCFDALNSQIEVQKCPVCSYRNFSGILCQVCRKNSDLTRLLFCHDYKNAVVRELIHAFKYGFLRELADPLSVFLINMVKKNKIRLQKTILVVPIPLHSAKLRKRGLNQSELLAKNFAGYFRLNMIADNLTRNKNTEPQIEMSNFKKRRENITGAFEVLRPEEFKNKKIILVDDVSTSRSTLEEAAKVLKGAGAKSIW